MFIQTEETPNPATLRFLPGQAVMKSGTADFTAPEQAQASPLAMALFAIEGIKAVYLGADFITITKADDRQWLLLKPAILGALMDHFTSGREVMTGSSTAAGHAAAGEGDDGDIIDQIIDLLDTRIRPAVAQDGGDITFLRYEDGVVYLSMRGSCAGCPSSTATLKNGIENMLRHYVPEVTEVRAG